MSYTYTALKYKLIDSDIEEYLSIGQEELGRS